MKNIYAYKVCHGYDEDCSGGAMPFIVFADSADIADAYIAEYIKKRVEEDKYKNDNGEIVNWWWKFTKAEKIDASEFNGSFANIAWI